MAEDVIFSSIQLKTLLKVGGVKDSWNSSDEVFDESFRVSVSELSVKSLILTEKISLNEIFPVVNSCFWRGPKMVFLWSQHSFSTPVVKGLNKFFPDFLTINRYFERKVLKNIETTISKVRR